MNFTGVKLFSYQLTNY